MTDERAKQRELHVEHLKAFVVRARRVRLHSFAANTAAMRRYREPSFEQKGRTRPDGTATLISYLPQEEVIESLAARARPFVLQDDPTYHAKVMKALLYFGGEEKADVAVMRQLRAKRKEWAEMSPRSTTHSSYAVFMRVGDGPQVKVTDTELGWSWLFGDVVHADPKQRALGKQFGIEERFSAAVRIIIRLADLSFGTLAFIEAMHKQGWLPELKDAFEEEVTVTKTVVRREGQAWSAEADKVTEPTLDGELGPEWEPFVGENVTITAKRDRDASGK